MSQASKIVAFIGIAFFVYVTAKGELPKYMSFFGIGDDTGSSSSAVADYGNTTKTITQQADSYASQVKSGFKLAEGIEELMNGNLAAIAAHLF